MRDEQAAKRLKPSLPVRPRDHRPQENVDARQRRVERGVLGLVVADAARARREDHRRRAHGRHVVAVVTCFRAQVHGRLVEIRGRLPDEPDETGIEAHHAEAPALRDLDLAPAAPRAIRQCRLDLGLHLREACRVRMPKIAEQGRPLGNDAGQVGPKVEARRRRLAFRVRIAPADLVDGDGHVRGRHERVLAPRHGGGTDMRCLPRDFDAHAARRKSARHHADADAGRIEPRPLLDMQFEIGVERPPAHRLRPRIADALQFVTEAHARLVGARVGPVDGCLPRERERTHHRRIEPRAFLVRPVDHFDRPFGLDAEIVERAQHFEARQHAENAVETAARSLRVEVAADQHRRKGRIGPLAAHEHVAELIDLEAVAAIAGPAGE